MKKAIIFGITGQDGSYLADLLLEKGYECISQVNMFKEAKIIKNNYKKDDINHKQSKFF